MPIERAIQILKLKRDLSELELDKKSDAFTEEFIKAIDTILDFFASYNNKN